MHRPEDLFDSVEDDAITRFLSWMIRCEAAVIRGMPVFCRDD
jgi:hypothetical protein